MALASRRIHSLEELLAHAVVASRDERNALWYALGRGELAVVARFERGGLHRVVATTSSARKPLSRRERQVLERIARGLALKVVAGELGVGVSSVSQHLNRAAAKLGAKSRAELVAAFLEMPAQ